MPGTSQKAVASTPRTAPRVLLAYSAAIGEARGARPASTRSIAGSVAPMAAVAGSSSKKQPTKATAPCHEALGWAPIRPSKASLRGAIVSANTRLHSAISSSQPAYQRAGRGLRSMRRPSTKAPSARPPKNAVMTAITAAASCPSQREACCVQTIW